MKKLTSILLVLFCCSLRPAHAQWDSIAYFNQVIFDLQSFQDNLFIAGNFTKQDGQTSYWSALYDGTVFYRHTNMVGGSGIDKMEVFDGGLYSVGGLTFSSSIGVGVWDGNTWVDGGSTNYSHSLICAVDDALYVQSDNNKMRVMVSGGSFQSFYDFPSGGATALYNYNGNLVVAGSFDSIGGVAAKNIAIWNGQVWEPLGSGISTGAKCIREYNGELYVAGSINKAGGATVKNIAKWDGNSWSDVGGGVTGISSNGLRDMVVFNGGLVVVGDFNQMGGVNTNDAAMWNGTQWIGLGLNHDDSFVQTAEVYENNLYIGTFDFDRSHLFKYTGNPNVGINEGETEHSNVYPNPFTDRVVFECPGNATTTVTLCDVTGRQVLQQVFNGSATINTELLTNGVYFYKVSNLQGVTETGKLVKQ